MTAGGDAAPEAEEARAPKPPAPRGRGPADLRYAARCLAGARPATLPLLGLANRAVRTWRKAVGPDTEICIEGFPRSANSFLLWFFRRANPGVVAAHHLHVAGNVLAAQARGLPTVVLLREPAEAAASLWGGLGGRVGPGVLLWSYADFLRRIEPALPGCVVADFPLATARPWEVIAATNARWGCGFADGAPAEGAEEAAAAEALEAFTRHAEAHARATRGGLALMTAPHGGKAAAKAAAREAILSHPRLPAARAAWRAASRFAIGGPSGAAED